MTCITVITVRSWHCKIAAYELSHICFVPGTCKLSLKPVAMQFVTNLEYPTSWCTFTPMDELGFEAKP